MKLKKILILSAITCSLTMITSCSLPTSNLTGNKIINAESENLVVQASVSMDDNNINSMTGGKLKEVLINEGDTVEAGQVIATLDSDSLYAKRDQILASMDTLNGQLNSAKAGRDAAAAQLQKAKNGAQEEELNQAKAGYDIAQSSFDLAQSNYDRTKALYDAGATTEANLESVQAQLNSAKSNLEISKNKYDLAVKGATPEDLAAAQSSVDMADAGIESVQGQIKAAQAQLQELQVSMDYMTVTAPASGVVTKLNVKSGDLVSSGMPLMVITQTDDPSLTCNIDETDLSKVELNQEVSIKVSALGDEEYTGKVVSINKNADFATKKATNDNGEFDILSYGVKVEFDDLENLQSNLRAGMTAFVDFGK